MNKLLQHFISMQDDMREYIVPDSNFSDADFINRMIYKMDGPEQREAQAEAEANTLAATIRNIERWAYDRNLVNGATSQAQMLKTTEEVGELAGAIARGKRDGIIDGIGDVVVTLVILAEQNGLEFADCVAAAYDEIKDRKGVMRDGIFIKEE